MSDDFDDEDDDFDDDEYDEAAVEAAEQTPTEVPRGISLFSPLQRQWWRERTVTETAAKYDVHDGILSAACSILAYECDADSDTDVDVSPVEGSSSMFRFTVLLPGGNPHDPSGYRAFLVDLADPPAWLVVAATETSKDTAGQLSIIELLDELPPGHPGWNGDRDETPESPHDPSLPRFPIARRPDDTTWICGEVPRDGSQWSFVGVFTEEQKAIDACRDDTYFVAPVKLDAVAPPETMEFPGAYFPLQGQQSTKKS